MDVALNLKCKNIIGSWKEKGGTKLESDRKGTEKGKRKGKQEKWGGTKPHKPKGLVSGLLETSLPVSVPLPTRCRQKREAGRRLSQGDLGGGCRTACGPELNLGL